MHYKFLKKEDPLCGPEFPGQIRQQAIKPEVLFCLTRLSPFVQAFTRTIRKATYFLLYHHPPSPQHTQTRSIIKFSCCNWQYSSSLPSPQQLPKNFSPAPKNQGRAHTNNSSKFYLDMLQINSQSSVKKYCPFPLHTQMYTIFPLRKLQGSLDGSK